MKVRTKLLIAPEGIEIDFSFDENLEALFALNRTRRN